MTIRGDTGQIVGYRRPQCGELLRAGDGHWKVRCILKARRPTEHKEEELYEEKLSSGTTHVQGSGKEDGASVSQNRSSHGAGSEDLPKDTAWARTGLWGEAVARTPQLMPCPPPCCSFTGINRVYIRPALGQMTGMMLRRTCEGRARMFPTPNLSMAYGFTRTECLHNTSQDLVVLQLRDPLACLSKERGPNNLAQTHSSAIVYL